MTYEGANLAIWAMPSIAYALASDTLIVVRARTLARRHHLGTALAADAATPLVILGGLILWLLRVALAPASTLSGFRAWVLQECPVAPGRRTRCSGRSPHRTRAREAKAAGPDRPCRGAQCRRQEFDYTLMLMPVLLGEIAGV